MRAENKDKKVYKDIASALLEEGKTIRIEASGYSMFPTIKPGNIIHIKAVKEKDKICSGDIIAWQRENDMVVHRLVHRYRHEEQCFFITRGDSSRSSDKPVSLTDIIGVVCEIETKAGKKIPLRKTLIKEFKYSINNRRVWILVRWKAILRKIGLFN